jgi:pyruvate, water dikinase
MQGDSGSPVSPGTRDPLRYRYRILRRVLASNSEILERLADLEAELQHLDEGHPAVREALFRLLDETLLLAENLNLLTDGAHAALYDVHRNIERSVRRFLDGGRTVAAPALVLGLDDVGAGRVAEVGGKAANLGRLRAALPGAVPPGFVVTTAAYRSFLDANRLHDPIRALLKNVSVITERDVFRERAAAIRALVAASPVPTAIEAAIAEGSHTIEPVPEGWAVRSSGVGEDGRMSFAGQFDTLLDVPRGGLPDAYRAVLASRWSDRAILYRLAASFTEVDTPMAVLFMPMLAARAAGVLYTRDPLDPEGERMLIDAVPGLADAMVRGAQPATTIGVDRRPPHEATSIRAPGGAPSAATPTPLAAPSQPALPDDSPLTPREVSELAALGLAVEGVVGAPQDVEWVLGLDGRLVVVQARTLRTEARALREGRTSEVREPILVGGLTIAPGRAAGPPVVAAGDTELGPVAVGSILVVGQATPELAGSLFAAGGLVAEAGNPAGHAAALIREFRVPAVFGVVGAIERLRGLDTVSLDATRRKVFAGEAWPGLVEETRARTAGAPRRRTESPLHEAVLALTLTDPFSARFRPRGCRSLHDIVRYTHEKAVAAMFELGDRAGRETGRRVRRLATAVPLDLVVLDLGGAIGEDGSDRRDVAPAEVLSLPFQALWRGVTAPGVSWTGRTQISVSGFASVIGARVAGSDRPARELGGRNYAIVGPDYLNLNARLAYHFAMVDALVGETAENNFVNFRFRGGAADARRRDLRARFLAEVLVGAGFGVDRRGDLVTAWVRRYPPQVCEAALELLGRLMACARQLDMLMTNEASMRRFVARFRAGELDAFA